MALGRPVVSTRVGGVGDAVEPGKTGWLVPPDDLEQYAQTLARAAADPAARTRMGLAAACAYEERYTLERMVEAYAAVLDRLTGRG